MITRKPTPDPIPRALAAGVAPRSLARADAALGSLALAAVAILASATIGGCTRPDTGGPSHGGDVIQVDVTAQPNDQVQPVADTTFQPRGACPPPISADGSHIEPDGDSPRLAGEPPIVMPATAAASGSAPPVTTPHPNPPPLPGKPVAPRTPRGAAAPGGNGRI